MKKIWTLLIVVLAGYFGSAQTNWYVATTGDDIGGDGSQGNPWQTIQHAIDQASSVVTDTIYVDAGTYAEKILIGKSVVLRGAKYGQDARTRSTVSGETILDGSSLTPPPYDAIRLASGVSNVTIDGFEIRNYTGSGYNGDGNAISSYVMDNETPGSSNVNILNNYIHDVGYNGILVGSEAYTGSLMTTQSGWLIQYNKIEAFTYAGVELTNVVNSQVKDNAMLAPTTLFDDPGDAGVGIEVAARSRDFPVTVTGIEVSGNTITGTFPAGSRAGINILSRTYAGTSDALLTEVTVAANTVTGATNVRAAVLVVSESRNNGPSSITELDITDNTLDGNAQGIEFQDYLKSGSGTPSHASITVPGNFIQNSTGSGIHVMSNTSGGGIAIHFNSLLGNGAYAIFHEGTGTLDASGNWYGTADLSEVQAMLSGSLVYTPYLTSGTDANLDEPGFQPLDGVNNGPLTTINCEGMTFSGQYSDMVPVHATLTGSEGPLEGMNVRFYIGYLDLAGEWVTVDSSEMVTSDENGYAMSTVKLHSDPDPTDPFFDKVSKATFRVVMTDPEEIYPEAIHEEVYNIRRENAIITITGITEFVTTPGTAADVTITVRVEDIDDGAENRGNITNAKIRFVFTPKGDGVPITRDVTLVSETDTTVGTATVTVSLPAGSFGAEPYVVHIYAGDYYRGKINATVTVQKAKQTDLISGGGFILLDGTGGGSYAGDAGTKTHFGFSAKNNKTATKVQGHAVIVFTHAGRIYQVTGNAQAAITMDPITGLATYRAKSTMLDITNDGDDYSTPQAITGLTLYIAVTDNGEPGKAVDEIGIQLYDGATLLFSNKDAWSTPVKQLLAGGNIQVRVSSSGGSGGGKGGPKQESAGGIAALENGLYPFQVNVSPNPAVSHFNLFVQGNPGQQVLVRIMDISGRLVDQYQAQSGTTIRFGAGYKSGLYLVQVSQGASVQTIKVMKE